MYILRISCGYYTVISALAKIFSAPAAENRPFNLRMEYYPNGFFNSRNIRPTNYLTRMWFSLILEGLLI